MLSMSPFAFFDKSRALVRLRNDGVPDTEGSRPPRPPGLPPPSSPILEYRKVIGVATKLEYKNLLPVETGVRECFLTRGVASSSFPSGRATVRCFEGVCAISPCAMPDFLPDGVSSALLPPDAESKSNRPRAFPSRCGVGPIAVRRGNGEED